MSFPAVDDLKMYNLTKEFERFSLAQREANARIERLEAQTEKNKNELEAQTEKNKNELEAQAKKNKNELEAQAKKNKNELEAQAEKNKNLEALLEQNKNELVIMQKKLARSNKRHNGTVQQLAPITVTAYLDFIKGMFPRPPNSPLTKRSTKNSDVAAGHPAAGGGSLQSTISHLHAHVLSSGGGLRKREMEEAGNHARYQALSAKTVVRAIEHVGGFGEERNMAAHPNHDLATLLEYMLRQHQADRELHRVGQRIDWVDMIDTVIVLLGDDAIDVIRTVLTNRVACPSRKQLLLWNKLVDIEGLIKEMAVEDSPGSAKSRGRG